MRAKPSRDPSIKISMMPRDTNVHDTIFGGVLLSHIDLAGAAFARRIGLSRVVTIAMKEVEFKMPVFVGDVVSYFCSMIKIGRTSLTVKVEVWAERFEEPHACEWVTDAIVTYVHVDENREKVPIPEELRTES